MLFVAVVIVSWSKMLKNCLYLETKISTFGEFSSTVKLWYNSLELGMGWMCAVQISSQQRICTAWKSQV